MDPLSLAASVIALATLCREVGEYLYGIKKAPKSAERLQAQVSSLRDVLTQLDTFLRKSTADGKTFAHTSALVQSTVMCGEQLLKVKEKLEKASKSIIHRITFPLDENEINQTINFLRGCAQTFHFSLNIDGCALLSETAEKAAASLRVQQETSSTIIKMAHELTAMTDLAREAQRTSESLSDILFTMSLPPVTVAEVDNLFEGIQRLQVASRSDRERIVLDWLAVPALSTEKHSDVKAQRTPNTGDWLLNIPAFREWVAAKYQRRAFICFGGPGVGKTVLTSLVIDHLNDGSYDQSTAVAWCYCDYRERSSLTPMAFAASLLRQLCGRSKSFPQTVLDFHELFKSDSPIKQGQYLMRTLINVCATFTDCFVVIDALDELESKHRKSILSIVKELQAANVKIFATTRPHLPDISRIFSSDIQQLIEAHEDDIKMFLTTSLAENEHLDDILDNQLTEEIVDILSRNANGLFLLPALQIQTITEQVSKSGIKSILRSLSSNLEEVFRIFIDRIKSQPGSRQQVASATLTWLAYAKRNLSLDELRHALATRLGDVELDRDNLISPRIIVESCLGLLIIEQENAAVRLVHLSLQEYLQGRRQDLFPSGDSMLAATCLTYSSFVPTLPRLRMNQADLASLVRQYPLLGYSSSHWGYHAAADMTPLIRELAMKLLSDKARVMTTLTIAYWDLGRLMVLLETACLPLKGNSLHCVSMFGMRELIPDLVRSGADIRKRNDCGNSPLHEATYFSQPGAVESLLKEGAVVDQENSNGNTALFLAAASGHREMLELLLDYGANVNANCRDNWMPLHKASDSGHLEAVEVLCEHGASLTLGSARGLTALHRASGRGHTKVAEFLLSKGSAIDVQTSDGWTPLHGAASSGRNEVVQLLLQKGANVNHMARDLCTPLHRACQGGYLNTVCTLLQSGADRLVANRRGEIPLHKAASGGHTSIVYLLLDAQPDMRGAQFDSTDIAFQCPRDRALQAAHYHLSKLLRHGHNNALGENAVEANIKSGNLVQIQEILAGQGILDEPDSNGLTPFHQAVSEKQYAIACLFLHHGARVDHAAFNGWTPLHTACKRGDIDCVRLCILHGASITSKDLYKRTPLHKACQGGNVDVVRLLAENGADLVARDSFSFTPMHACAEAGYEDVARFLRFEYHLDLESRTADWQTCQAVAARAGHHALAEFLRAYR